MSRDVRELLRSVRDGSLPVEEAELLLREEPFVDMGYAKIDLHRKIRQGQAEVIYGEGKTAAQISGIVRAMLERGQKGILITRLSAEKAEILRDTEEFRYYDDARIGIVGQIPEPDGCGTVVVATGGTSDIPVAEEAALTAAFCGSRVVRLYDVGVAGLHRLLAHTEELMGASVVIAVAGMEGALASVIGGLVDCPVIAVPTSVGYGASFSGLAALLSMLNSCASGVSVVNIDNGFGAGFLADRINHPKIQTTMEGHQKIGQTESGRQQRTYTGRISGTDSERM